MRCQRTPRAALRMRFRHGCADELLHPAGLSHKSGSVRLLPTLLENHPDWNSHPRRVAYKRKMTRTSCHACQHTASLRLREEFRRTAGGHTEADGKTVVCGACGDSWHFRDRLQLPEWLRQELTDRGL